MEDNSDKKSNTKNTLIKATLAAIVAAIGVFMNDKWLHEEMFREVKFLPRVGKHYDHSRWGKRVMVLG